MPQNHCQYVSYLKGNRKYIKNLYFYAIAANQNKQYDKTLRQAAVSYNTAHRLNFLNERIIQWVVSEILKLIACL